MISFISLSFEDVLFFKGYVLYFFMMKPLFVIFAQLPLLQKGKSHRFPHLPPARKRLHLSKKALHFSGMVHSFRERKKTKQWNTHDRIITITFFNLIFYDQTLFVLPICSHDHVVTLQSDSGGIGHHIANG